MASADLLLHPVRLRIVQEFLGRGELTTSALREALEDVPVATLYRHVTALLDGGVLEVMGERKVRGAVERTLVLRAGAASVSGAEAAAMTVDDHRRGFLTFVAGLLAHFDDYLGRGDIDLARDFTGYRQAAAHLSDTEMQEFLDDLRAVIAPRLENGPGPHRTRRLITTIVMPAADRAADPPRAGVQP